MATAPITRQSGGLSNRLEIGEAQGWAFAPGDTGDAPRTRATDPPVGG